MIDIDHAPLATPLVFTQNTRFFELIHQAAGPIVANAQPTLQQTNRTAATLAHNAHRLGKKIIARVSRLERVNLVKEWSLLQWPTIGDWIRNRWLWCAAKG